MPLRYSSAVISDMTNNAIALLIGCNLGYDMLGVDLDTGDVGFSGDFYVSPSLSIGIRY